MKPWQRNPPPIIAPRPNPDAVPIPPALPARLTATPPGTPAPLVVPDAGLNLKQNCRDLVVTDAGLNLEQRVAGLETKAHYDGQYIAQLRAELTAAGQCIDALTCRLGKLADKLDSGAGISQPGADNPPGEVGLNSISQ